MMMNVARPFAAKEKEESAYCRYEGRTTAYFIHLVRVQLKFFGDFIFCFVTCSASYNTTIVIHMRTTVGFGCDPELNYARQDRRYSSNKSKYRRGIIYKQ